MNNRHSAILMFLIGLGSETQFHFIGSLGISEWPIFVLAPFIFLIDYRELRKDGFLPFIWLTIFTCISCCISSALNSTPPMYFIKGFAHPYALFSITVVFHRLLRHNLMGVSWFWIGYCLSCIVNVFAFQPESYIAVGATVLSGEAAIERMMDNELFWTSRIKNFVELPVKAFYLKTPFVYSVLAPVVSAFVAITMSRSSGRSVAGAALMAMLLLLLGRKSRGSMRRLGKHMLLFVSICLVFGFAVKSLYSWTASKGILGYDAKIKYERQTRTGSSMLHLLMAGRMELFCGVMACMDRPIFGFGPKAEDTEGYVARYLSKYGAEEDYQNFVASLQRAAKRGHYVYIGIPAHSHIAFFWIYYGIIGLILWIYVLWLVYMYFKKYASAIPQWYGYLAMATPSIVWAIFFSAFAARVSMSMFVTCLLMGKAVANGRVALPLCMESEAQKCA